MGGLVTKINPLISFLGSEGGWRSTSSHALMAVSRYSAPSRRKPNQLAEGSLELGASASELTLEELSVLVTDMTYCLANLASRPASSLVAGFRGPRDTFAGAFEWPRRPIQRLEVRIGPGWHAHTGGN